MFKITKYSVHKQLRESITKKCIQNQKEMKITLVAVVEKISNLGEKNTHKTIYIRIYIGNNNWPYKYLLYLHQIIHKYLKRKQSVGFCKYTTFPSGALNC